MSSGVLRFSCRACHSTLTVPETMAGIEGPCPKCGTHIRAPQFSPPTSDHPSTQSPLPTSPWQRPPSHPLADTEEEPKTRIAPEPRKRPSRAPGASIQPRHSTSDSARRRSSHTPRDQPSPRQPHHSREHPTPQEEPPPRSQSSDGAVSRLLVPALLGVLGGGIIALLIYVFLPNPNGTAASPPQTPTNPASEAANPGPANTPRSQRGIPTTPISNAPPTDPSAAFPGARDQTNSNPGNDSDSALSAERLALASEKLNTFLTSKLLSTRIGMVEPALASERLIGTPLADPFPTLVSLTPRSPVAGPAENAIDVPFLVDFEETNQNRPSRYTVLVRSYPDRPPKILINPLLDLYGGQLATYAQAPRPKTATFQAIVEAVPRCFERDIPRADQKFTYKVFASDEPAGAQPLARVYADLQSSLAEELWTPESPMRWGHRLRCTIRIRWNTDEDPERPFLEMEEIVATEWTG